MPAGVDMTWRGVRPLLPGVVGRLSASTAVTAATRRPATRLPTERRHHTLMRPPTCALCLCRSRRTRTVAARPLLFHYSSASNGSSTSGTADGQPTTVSYQAMAKDLEDKRRRDLEDRLRQRQQQQQPSSAAASTTNPGTVMMDSLSREPSLPLPPPTATNTNTTTTEASARRPTATSALTKPIIHHAPPNEIVRSRKQHVKSVVRQGRLEIIRQMQGLQMVDWRQVLKRLAMSTPREDAYERVSVATAQAQARAQRTVLERDDDDGGATARDDEDEEKEAPRAAADAKSVYTASSPAKIAGWRPHAVLLVFPADSPSVTELVHGVDDSMWSIWSRTGSVLKLFHWQGSPRPAAGLDFTDRPWLLSISGTSDTAISRAVLDVVRFAKDAEAVALGPSDLALLDDMWTTPAVKEEGTSSKTDARPQPQTESAEKIAGPWKLELSSYYHDSKYAEDPVFLPYVANIGAHEIPRPDVWTPASFERYVAALVNGTPPPQLAAKIYHEQIAQDSAMPQPAYSLTEAEAEAEAHTAARSGQHPHQSQPKPKPNSRQQPIAPSHSRTVIGLLQRAFHDDSARSSVSLSAFKMALTYMCRFGEASRPEVRRLFTRIEELRIPMDTETFNIILASHVKSQDVRNYGSTLRLMRSRQHGYTPDLTTWLLFLRLFWSDEVKRHILHTMSARGLLNTSRAVRLVALEMAEHDAQQAVLRAGDAASLMPNFLAAQAQRYGARWLSRAAANRILNVLASHARFDACDALLAALQEKQDADTARPRRPKSAMKRARAREREQRANKKAARTDAALNPPPGFVAGLSLDTFTYNIVLTHCKVQNDLAAALVVLRRMEVAGAPRVPDNVTSYVAGRPWLPRIPPDSATYHLLFAMAWAHRLPHTMAVIWHYACANLQARHWILMRASRELVERDGGRRPIALAYYLTGVDPDDARAMQSVAPPPRSASGHKPQHMAGLAMSTRIAAQYKGLEPAEPLSKVLEQAMARDAAMQASPETAAAQPRMKIRLRRRILAKEDEFLKGIASFSYMAIPVKWGAFKTIEYSR